jgi:hypothetical protein
MNAERRLANEYDAAERGEVMQRATNTVPLPVQKWQASPTSAFACSHSAAVVARA